VELRVGDEVDLARLARQDAYGHGDDLSPGALGLRLTGGIRPLSLFELDLDAAFAVGGLDLGEVERRYLGGGTESLGSSATLEAGVAALALPPLGPNMDLVAGAAAGWHRMVTSSPAGGARVSSLAVGPALGIRWCAVHVGRAVDGVLELRLDARYHRALDLEVARDGEESLFATDSPAADAFYTVGFALTWLFAFR
jgi:hypothetical protein